MIFIQFFKEKKVLLIVSLIHLGFYLVFGLFPSCFVNESALIPYQAQQIDVQKAFYTPSWQLRNHFWGTDHLGRDVLAGIIQGCQTSLWISLPAMLIATIIGLCLGLISGYFGNDRKKTNAPLLMLYFIALIIGSYYSFYLQQFSIMEAFEDSFFEGLKVLLLCIAIVTACLLFVYSLKSLIKKKQAFACSVALPLDEGVLKLTELFSSIPKLILILALASFLQPSLGMLVFIIGLTSWTGMTRLVRGEILKVKRLQFIEAGTALGLKDQAVILQHILPNILPPVAVAFTFGLANLLTVEATLSFLGIGLPPDYISWGKIIAGVRHNLSAWWLVVFPGIYLSLTVLSLHYCSNYLLRKMQ